MTAEDLVPEESLRLSDKAIQETSAKLKALGDLEVFAEKEMAVGTQFRCQRTFYSEWPLPFYK